VLEICDTILNISVVKRDKGGYWIAGIPVHSCDKFSRLLVANNHVVVFVTDVESNLVGKKSKKITKVLSPSCKLMDASESEYICEENASILASILVYSVNKITTCSICFANTSNGKLNVIPSMEGGLDILLEKCSEIITSYGNVIEILLNVVRDDNSEENLNPDLLKSKLGIRGILTHFKEHEFSDATSTFLDSILYQRVAMENFFKNFKTIYKGIFENIGLQRGNDVGNLILVIEFLEMHGDAFVKDLELPSLLNTVSSKYVSDKDVVRCYNGFFEKMKIFSKDKNKHSIFEHLDRTNTVAGKRKLNEFLQNPITCPLKLNARYDSVETLTSHPDLLKILKENLKMCDLERYNRKVVLTLLKPPEIPRIQGAYEKITNIYNCLKRKEREHHEREENKNFLYEVPMENDWNVFTEYCAFLQNTFHSENCQMFHKKISGAYVGKNIFRPGVFPELDDIFSTYDAIHAGLDALCETLGDSIVSATKSKSANAPKSQMVSISRTEKGGVSLSVTKTRSKNIDIELLKFNGITIDNSKSQSILKSKFISESSDKLTDIEEKLGREFDRYMILKQREIQEKFGESAKKITDWITHLDVYYSFAVTSVEFNLKRPKIVENDLGESSFRATGLRNVLIENILEKQNKRYVSNDLKLSADSSMLLFGCNSAGKSAFLRATAHAVILAQAGSFVPAESFSLTPYHKVFVRMGNADEEHNSMSSFTKECSEMNQIVNYACKNSLVISDEACSTSETASATVIVATLMEVLAVKRVSFLFVSHLFQLLDIQSVNDLPSLNICHLKVTVSPENVLVFERKLSQGCGNKRYGCLVAKKIINNQLFLNRLERNLNKISAPESSNVEVKKNPPKRSKYNKNVLVVSCQICGYEPKTKTDQHLDVHHIIMQQNFKCGEFLGDLRKNQSSNLIVCCKKCHQDIHRDLIDVKGYVETENGSNLVFHTK
jgi:DNA mismatch repair protein MutS